MGIFIIGIISKGFTNDFRRGFSGKIRKVGIVVGVGGGDGRCFVVIVVDRLICRYVWGFIWGFLEIIEE